MCKLLLHDPIDLTGWTTTQMIVKNRFRMKLRKKWWNWKNSDTIQPRSNSDFDVKCAAIQFYGNSYNSQFDHWIGLKFYMESPDMFSYLGFKFQINRSSGRHRNTGQQRLYEFCWLLPFNLWTSYLASILFLKGCGSLF